MANTEAMERNGMLSAPMTKLERDTLIEYTGAEHCDYCRLGTGPLCSSCAVKLRWEATVRALESGGGTPGDATPPKFMVLQTSEFDPAGYIAEETEEHLGWKGKELALLPLSDLRRLLALRAVSSEEPAR